MNILIASICAILIAGCGQSHQAPEKRVQDSPMPQAEVSLSSPQKTVRTVHVFVALCDNKHQGIVPVSAILGNGDDPRNNLYWGAMYGIRTFFKKSAAWSIVAEEDDPKDNILQRVVFKHSSGRVYLVADAYRGAKIKQALVDFFDAAAGHDIAVYKFGNDVLGVNANADLVAYVGHNGLMDFNVQQVEPKGAQANREAIVLACKSKPYFLPRLTTLGCKSILLTTGLMAPEAYTLEAVVTAWINNEDGKTIRERAAGAYNKYQKCGLNGARRLFFSE